MADPTHAPSDHDPAPEDLPALDMLYDEPLGSGRQTVLLLGSMGLGFLFLLVVLFVVAG